VRDDGFTEFKVSGYGRTNITGSEQITDEYFTRGFSTSGIVVGSNFVTTGDQTINAIFKSELLTKEIVLLQGETIDPTTDKIPQKPTLIYDGETGLGVFAIFMGIYHVGIRNYTARNFGRISEVSVTYAPFEIISR
jgi:hypothetical protein